MRLELTSRAFLVLLAACAIESAGCARHKSPTTQPTAIATDVDPDQAKSDYWLARPATASTPSIHYEHLFRACSEVLRGRYFQVDRSDYRNGVVTSRPLVSQQVWEFWRQDVGSYSQQLSSSVATYRRTVHWTIVPGERGGYVATPKVVVERFTDEPRRITAVTSYRSAANSAAAQTRLDSPSLEDVKMSRWYAVGRDEVLEKQLAQHASDWLVGK